MTASGEYSAPQFLAKVAAVLPRAKGYLGEIDTLIENHRRITTISDTRTELALSALAQRVLPDLSSASRARADRLLGMRMLPERLSLVDPEQRVRDERAKYAAAIAAIEADPLWPQRFSLEPSGLPATLQRLKAERVQHTAFVERCNHPRLEELIEVQYGTELYGVGFWRYSYYVHWQAADEVLERIVECSNFGEVRAELLKARQFLAGCDAWVDRLERELAAITALVRQHGEQRRMMDDVERVVSRALRAQVVERIQKVGAPLLAAWFAEEPAVLDLALRYEGTRLQGVYLREILDTGIQPIAGALRTHVQGLARDSVKFSSPKRSAARVDVAKLERRLALDEKLHKRFGKQRAAYNAVAGFTAFERGRFHESFLWWELMVGPVTAAVAVPTVLSYLQQHPNHVPLAAAGDDEGAAAAVAELAETAADLATDAS